MGVDYYVFALFIAALVCVVAIIFKILFSNVKRQSKIMEKMFDERETKFLHIYNSAETLMEEFQDQAKATIDELKLREQEYRAALQNMAAFQLPPELEKKEIALERAGRSVGPDANKMRVAGEIIERADHLIAPENMRGDTPAAAPAVPEIKPEPKKTVFKSFFDDAAQAPAPAQYTPAQISGGSRKDEILALSDEGKTDVEIASRLGITRNEVRLVVGLTK